MEQRLKGGESFSFTNDKAYTDNEIKNSFEKNDSAEHSRDLWGNDTSCIFDSNKNFEILSGKEYIEKDQQNKEDYKLDQRTEKIYENSGVDIENPRNEILEGRNYEVYQLKDINPDLETPDGRTNKERMENGEAPYVLRDDKLVKVELHHNNQQDRGPLVELDSNTHRREDNNLHPNTGKGEGRGDDRLWNARRNEHWKQRSMEFENN